MNIKRVTSALLGFPLVAAILILGNTIVVDIAFAIIAAMSLHEFFNAFKAKAKPVIWIGYVAAALIAIIHVIPKEHILNVVSVIVPLFIFVLFLQVILSNMKTNIKDIAVTFFGICYIPLFLMFIPLLNGLENGKILIWFVLLAAWGTDIFAYIIGKTMGKHKFSKISPNKTIEGCIGGTIGSVILILIYAYICNTFFSLNIGYLSITIIGIILSIIGQIGDFAASSIKRYVGIKDFSNLIPGHG
ncbi:MAG: phosphatidate cytidylyltransferase, partial [Clostridia bacterium]